MDINPTLVKDKRINQITDSCDYAVYSGASQNTFQQFPATTQSASNISFNVQVPSENIVVDRNVLISSTVNFTIAITNVPAGAVAFNIGSNDALQSFPLNKLFTTSSATINNSSVSVNTQDVIDALLKQIPQEQLQKYQGMTPVYTDGAYRNYTDAQTTTNNPLGGYQNSAINNLFLPRGAHPITPNSYWRLSGGVSTASNLTSTALTDVFYINCSVNLTEPLMCLSPFLFGADNVYNSQGLVGVNSINVVLNVDSSCKRFWSTANSGYTYTVSLGNLANATVGAVAKNAFENTNMLLNFLSTQPTDLVKAKNVVAYSDFPRYLTTNLTTLGGAGSNNSYSSQNIQLNQIPDKLFIFVRKQMASQDVRDSATFLPIKNISINFSNASGLLASATQMDLWKMSVENGLQMNWYEFSGYGNKQNAGQLGLKTASGGSVLVINPAKDLSLPAYLSNGSLGQFSLQFNITVENTTAITYSPEIVVVCQNSGVFVSQSGSSSIFTGVLSKQMVLDTVANQEAFDSGEYDRLVGGMKMSSALKAVPRPMKRVAGAMSAGVRSAGRKLDAMAM